MYLATTPSECSTCQQQKTTLSAYVHHFLRRLSVHLMASCLPWAPSTLKSSEIESDRNRPSRYELPLLSIVSRQTSLPKSLFYLPSKVGMRVGPWQMDSTVISCSWKCGSKQWWVDGYEHGDSLSIHLRKKGFMSPNGQVLSAPSGIFSASETPLPVEVHIQQLIQVRVKSFRQLITMS